MLSSLFDEDNLSLYVGGMSQSLVFLKSIGGLEGLVKSLNTDEETGLSDSDHIAE